MRKIPLLLILLVIVIFAPRIASAESFQLVIDENYSYRNIKNVLITCSLAEKAQTVDPYVHLNFPKDVVGRMQKKSPNVEAHTLVQARQLLDQKTGGEYRRLLSANDPNASTLLEEFIVDYYDVVVHVNIMAFDYVIRPSDQKTLLNPLGLEWCANVRIAYSLVSAKTGNKIIEKTDIFVDGSSVEIEKSDSRNMFVKWFNKLIEEDKKNAPSERHLD